MNDDEKKTDEEKAEEQLIAELKAKGNTIFEFEGRRPDGERPRFGSIPPEGDDTSHLSNRRHRRASPYPDEK